MMEKTCRWMVSERTSVINGRTSVLLPSPSTSPEKLQDWTVHLIIRWSPEDLCHTILIRDYITAECKSKWLRPLIWIFWITVWLNREIGMLVRRFRVWISHHLMRIFLPHNWEVLGLLSRNRMRHSPSFPVLRSSSNARTAEKIVKKIFWICSKDQSIRNKVSSMVPLTWTS